jgi:hypothetical protein
VKLPRPRNRVEMADVPEYNHYRAEVLKFLYARHGKAVDQAGGAEIRDFPKARTKSRVA